ncbi:MAG: hypothetical protein K2J01_03145 [Clostridiales bacterium]|nr:hypothetical protein [Clostridiales bacterium]
MHKKKFKKGNKVEFTLRIAAILSFGIFVLGIVLGMVYKDNKDYQKWGIIVQGVSDLCTNLIMSYLFFLIAFLPENRKQISIDNVVSAYIAKIHAEYVEFIEISTNLVQFNGQKIAKLSDSPKKRTMLQSDNERTFLTYLQHILYFYNKSRDLKQEMTPFLIYMDDDFREKLYKYFNANIFQDIHLLLVDSPSESKEKSFLSSFSSNIKELELLASELFN